MGDRADRLGVEARASWRGNGAFMRGGGERLPLPGRNGRVETPAGVLREPDGESAGRQAPACWAGGQAR